MHKFETQTKNRHKDEEYITQQSALISTPLRAYSNPIIRSQAQGKVTNARSPLTTYDYAEVPRHKQQLVLRARSVPTARGCLHIYPVHRTSSSLNQRGTVEGKPIARDNSIHAPTRIPIHPIDDLRLEISTSLRRQWRRSRTR